jgi:3' exoribonuclease, RNase T-like
MKDVMIDCETLATTADAVILSIGAVKFDLETGQIDDAGFYASIDIDDSLAHGRRISESTLVWWMAQDKKAQAVFNEPKQDLESALRSFVEWLGHDRRRPWSNGADFDIPMLAHAFTHFRMDVPWQFWNARCVRTYKTLPAAGSVPMFKNDHNALRDAVNQAVYVQAVYACMVQK